jgi:hypothetical protein
VLALLRTLEYFDIRKLGAVAWFLGMEVIRDRESKSLLVSQRCYASEILQRSGMEDCKGKSTPMEQSLELSKAMIWWRTLGATRRRSACYSI